MVRMNRRAIHITRKSNRAANDMDCAVIHMEVPPGVFLIPPIPVSATRLSRAGNHVQRSEVRAALASTGIQDRQVPDEIDRLFRRQSRILCACGHSPLQLWQPNNC
jgi:hypothetical protein